MSGTSIQYLNGTNHVDTTVVGINIPFPSGPCVPRLPHGGLLSGADPGGLPRGDHPEGELGLRGMLPGLRDVHGTW